MFLLVDSLFNVLFNFLLFFYLPKSKKPLFWPFFTKFFYSCVLTTFYITGHYHAKGQDKHIFSFDLVTFRNIKTQ